MTALTAGLVGAFALGVAVGPAIHDGFTPQSDRMVSAEPAPADVPAPAPPARPTISKKARSAVLMRESDAKSADSAPSERTAAPVARQVTEPALHARLKPVLNRGAKLELAADGFRDAEQFAMVAHAARNTEVPFMVLKHRVLNEGRTLASAIRESKPQLDAAMEVQKARDQAREDLAATSNSN
jgi:hypothetical protein